MPPPLVIPFFIPHYGCPQRCTFCNQTAITGRSEGAIPGAEEIGATIRSYLATKSTGRGETQVAFFGGSFSGLPDDLQEHLLGAVAPFLADGRVAGIRISTRPDYLDPARIDFLKNRGVVLVELGVQSLDDAVLARCGRGHAAADSLQAIRLLQAAGLRVGVQLMVGLPGERMGRLLAGAKVLAALQPELARLYPVLVLKGSRLGADYLAGRYQPLGLRRAVALGARLREIFRQQGVRVVRVGLQETDTLAGEILAGPHHPAFGELVLSWSLHRRLRKLLAARGRESRRLVIASADQSVFRGPGNSCLDALRRKGLLEGVEVVFDPEQPRGEARCQSVPRGGFDLNSDF
ncbi:MAG: radical SAM protein [Desulfobulbaceae bacterium]|nr:radical SAM protein [Desulfobulbaceae bacterium]